MARLESIYYTPHRCNVIDSQVVWTPVAQGKVINNLPLIFWEGGSPWQEANQWLHERATCHEVQIRTIESNATALLAYASWLEKASVDWWVFPPRKSDRCLIRYRGALIEARDNGEIASSTRWKSIFDVFLAIL